MPATAQPLQQTASLNLADLEVGDIIATSADTKNSRTIRWATNSPYSHAILYDGYGYGIEALPGPGVVKRPIYLSIADTGSCKVFRHKFADTVARDRAVSWAALQIGRSYDYTGAARVGLQSGSRTRVFHYTTLGFLISLQDVRSANRSDSGHDETFFCSELIARAYEVAGAPIVNRPAAITGPGHFLVTDRLTVVGWLNAKS